MNFTLFRFTILERSEEERVVDERAPVASLADLRCDVYDHS